MPRIPSPFTVTHRASRDSWEISLNPESGLPVNLCRLWHRKTWSSFPPALRLKIGEPKNRTQARNAAQALINHLRSDAKIPRGLRSISIREYATLFTDASTSPRAVRLSSDGRDYSPKTLNSYRGIIQRCILSDEVFCALSMAGADEAAVRAFLARLVKKTGQTRTYQAVWTVLRMIFKEYSRFTPGWDDPFTRIAKPTYAVKRRMALTEEEARAIFDPKKKILRNSREKAIASLAFWAGLRRSEVLVLRWDDFHFEEQYIEVSQAMKDADRRTKTVGSTKSKRARKVVLVDRVAKAVKALSRNGEYVLGQKDFLPMGTAEWKSTFAAIFSRMGIDWKSRGISAHSARHTFATILYKEGVPIRYIQDMLGHHSLKVTDIYIDMPIDEVQKIAKRIG